MSKPEVVYLVVSGEYSDFTHHAVFKTKEAADKFIELHRKKDEAKEWGWGYCDMEAVKMPLYDKGDLKEEISVFIIEYRLANGKEIIKHNTGQYYDFLLYEAHRTDIRNPNVDYLSLYLRRVVDKDCDEEKLAEKYTKVCRDFAAKIKSLVLIESWTDKMLEEVRGIYDNR